MNIKKYKTIIFLIVTLTNINLYSQKTLQIDFFKTLTLNVSTLQDYMINLNFEFNGVENIYSGSKYTWTKYRNNIDTSRAEIFFSLYINNDNSKRFSYQSTKKEEYIRFKNIIKSKGLIFRKTKNFEGKLVEYFANSKFESEIWTGVVEGVTVYEMNLELIKY